MIEIQNGGLIQMINYVAYVETDNEKTELELSGLDPVALEFMRYEERVKVLRAAGLDPAKYDF